MKNNNMTSFIIVSGILVLVVFISIVTLNLLPNEESNSYYTKVNPKMDAKIELLVIDNGVLHITTSGYPTEYCVKTTKSYPELNSLCWNELIDNNASIQVLEDKKYYVWIKDKNNNISEYSWIK